MILKPLVIFDMDGVLVYPRSSWKVIHDHFGVDNEDSFLMYMDERIDDMEFMRRDISLWRKRKPDLDRYYLEDIFRGVKRMRGIDLAVKTINDLGADNAIVSGGIDILADQIASELPFRHVHANGFVTDTSGLLTGEGNLNVPLRNKGKVLKFLKDRGDYTHVVTIGDSLVDGTMFDLSDLSIGFRPMEDEVEEMVDVVVEGDDLSITVELIRDWIGD